MSVTDDLICLRTDGINISVGSVLVNNDNAENDYMWGYYMCVENDTPSKIKLVGKDWNITDDQGNRYHDSSVGFKGEMPELEPGEFFEYTSYAPLKAQNAVIYGSCKVISGSEKKDVKIPTFSLSAANDAKGRVVN
ncbi:MAG: ApaG domain-containing protein [Alphaproteobacteria bacterium]|nr:ApaG domain-containing protein [Alphaproteobacteria bacterium]